MLGNPASKSPQKPGDCTHGLFFAHHFYPHQVHGRFENENGHDHHYYSNSIKYILDGSYYATVSREVLE